MNVAKPYAVVTGSNRGIGLEIVRQLVTAGVGVLATSRDPSRGTHAASQLGADYAPLDVTSEPSIDALARQLTGGFDILVNNAGASFNGFDEEVARKTLDVNFYGAMHTTDRLLPVMRRGGRIVMVSSGMGELSAVSPALRARFEDPRLTRADLTVLCESFVRDVAAGTHSQKGWPSSAYRVSKMALNAFTRLLARELTADPRRILVNATCPGWVRTDMGGESAPRSPAKGAETPVWLALLPQDDPGDAHQGGFFRDKRPVEW